MSALPDELWLAILEHLSRDSTALAALALASMDLARLTRHRRLAEFDLYLCPKAHSQLRPPRRHEARKGRLGFALRADVAPWSSATSTSTWMRSACSTPAPAHCTLSELYFTEDCTTASLDDVRDAGVPRYALTKLGVAESSALHPPASEALWAPFLAGQSTRLVEVYLGVLPHEWSAHLDAMPANPHLATLHCVWSASAMRANLALLRKFPNLRALSVRLFNTGAAYRHAADSNKTPDLPRLAHVVLDHPPFLALFAHLGALAAVTLPPCNPAQLRDLVTNDPGIRALAPRLRYLHLKILPVPSWRHALLPLGAFSGLRHLCLELPVPLAPVDAPLLRTVAPTLQTLAVRHRAPGRSVDRAAESSAARGADTSSVPAETAQLRAAIVAQCPLLAALWLDVSVGRTAGADGGTYVWERAGPSGTERQIYKGTRAKRREFTEWWESYTPSIRRIWKP
ncbi:hypothetical protein MIND_01343000 [Mycena indigotica]|uniref:F-box domain-containing protein n=1 Tax=Mycena indigotica TaxID=2126181 RepID=A0A8H6RYK0_9AGAR|nr:uncharacterized protein MIND_01343000 [Mycena indigotica]KAF7289699.1 hypothetical protein MIND_01343000 [Mycena indigotica]